MSKKEFKKGDLVVHAKGTVYPHKYIQGVVMRDDLFDDPAAPSLYRVFWYTTGRWQNLTEECLKLLDNSLT
jgi:hypothetical protein|tara:strand:+ start:1126 stop:1338 length:213 start_codon:yes stop_codon:yes gene_type:complete